MAESGGQLKGKKGLSVGEIDVNIVQWRHIAWSCQSSVPIAHVYPIGTSGGQRGVTLRAGIVFPWPGKMQKETAACGAGRRPVDAGQDLVDNV